MLVNGLFMLTAAHLLSVFTSWIIQSLETYSCGRKYISVSSDPNQYE